jgi:hypothetical protein
MTRSKAWVWTLPKFKRGEVDRAGLALLSAVSKQDREASLGVVDNWRSSHNYPLHSLTMSLRARARSVDQDALIAQRLKRLNSITSKLEREPTMKLSQMQDIGGCRAVVRDAHCLAALIAKFERARNKCWEFHRKYDYVAHPKTDGYRSVHLVYRYSSDSSQRALYNKIRIEVQFRSRLQHTWATALETVDTFTRQALKANRGEPEWQRFFTLMGHSIALREGHNAVPGAPYSRAALVEEIAYLASKINVVATLQGLTTAVQVTAERSRSHFFLLTLDFGRRKISILPFSKTEAAVASEKYSELEKAHMGNPDIQTVLVSVGSLDALRLTYPNYYLDTTAFVKLLEEDIEDHAAWPPRAW